MISTAASVRSGGKPIAFSTFPAIVSFGNLARRYFSKKSCRSFGFNIPSRRAARSSPSASGAMVSAFTPPSMRPYAIAAPANACHALLVGLMPIAKATSGGEPPTPAKLSTIAEAIFWACREGSPIACSRFAWQHWNASQPQLSVSQHFFWPQSPPSPTTPRSSATPSR